MPELTGDQITRHLACSHFGYRKNVCVPRCTFAGWEADLLVLRPSGWMEEVEVKISRADFMREFTTKADKHLRFERGNPARVLSAEGFDPANPLHRPNAWRGQRVAGYSDWSAGKPHKLRRFWFAVPLALVPKIRDDVPAHAGLLAIGGGGVQEWKPAPILRHGRKLTDAERVLLMRLAYLRYWDVFDREMAARGREVANA